MATAQSATLQPCVHDGIPARETWLDCVSADGGRLRLVLLAEEVRATATLLASARAIAQALPARLDAALRFLWQAGREAGDPDDAPIAFMAGFAPSDLVMAADGGYVLHLAPRDAAWFMPGYWPSLRFSADHAPAGWTCES